MAAMKFIYQNPKTIKPGIALIAETLQAALQNPAPSSASDPSAPFSASTPAAGACTTATSATQSSYAANDERGRGVAGRGDLTFL